MKFQRSTVILVGVALLLGAGVLVAESQRAQRPDTAELGQNLKPMLGFAETDVVSLTVTQRAETLVFERDEEGNWQMTQPETSPAEPGAIAFLLSRLNTDSPLQQVTMAADMAADFGLDAPQGEALVTLKDGTQHRLILGGEDFSGSANYALIDPPTWPPKAGKGDYTVFVVSRDVANGLNRPREEWKMPVDSPTEGAANDQATPTPKGTDEPPTEPANEPQEADPQSPPEETN